MKKVLIMILGAMLAGTVPSSAQNESQEARETFSQKFARLVNQTVTQMEQAGHAIGDAIGFDDRVSTETSEVARRDVKDYMPLYTVNLYGGTDAVVYVDECRSLFSRKFPGVEIVTAVVPQKEWLRDAVKEDGKVTGYVQTLYCYVIGKDGDDGYINARFVFQRYKEVGGQYRHVADRWPLWERSDAIPAELYEKMKK